MTAAEQELRRLAEENGGVTAEIVVEAARPKSSVLHDHIFYGTQRQAAEDQYAARARHLIRRYNIRIKTGENRTLQVRAFHHVKTEDEAQYVTHEQAYDNPVYRESILRRMQLETEGLVRRYEHLSEFWALLDNLRVKKVA